MGRTGLCAVSGRTFKQELRHRRLQPECLALYPIVVSCNDCAVPI